MIKKIIWTIIFTLIAVLMQSTIFSRLSIYIYAVPDLALGILVFSAYLNGTMPGQLSGFFSGFLMDFLSAAPLGLNALIRTLVGALTGLMKGTFFLDIIFLPMALSAGATVLKAFIYFLLHLLFPDAVPSYTLFALTFWVELGLNTLLAPFLFSFLHLFESLLVVKKENA